MRKLQIIATTLFLLVTVSCTNGKTKSNTEQETAANKIASVDHSAFDKLLKTNVSDKGIVDYKAFVKDKVALQNYIKSLTQVKTSKLNKNERTAFWINAYNALTIHQIVKHYPVTSITKIAGGKVWDQVLPYQLDGKSLTLNDIEKKILLGAELFDARVHFAVNCAAVSCPTLINKAYTGSNVQEMLTKNTKSALSNPAFNKISSKSASISKLFDWYKADFVKAEGSVVNFINKYSPTKISNQTKIDYLAYNWNLNGK